MESPMTIQNMTFKVGQVLTVVGAPTADANRFSINIGHDMENIALHFNPRFDENKVICNSKDNATWRVEHRAQCCPFQRGKEFEVEIKFTSDGFVTTTCGSTEINFPNRLGAEKYMFFYFGQDVRIQSFKIQ